MKKYYIHDGVKQIGEFTYKELEQLTIQPNYYIWYDGLTDWKMIKDLDELKELTSKSVTSPSFLQKPDIPLSNEKTPNQIDKIDKSSTLDKAPIGFHVFMITSILCFSLMYIFYNNIVVFYTQNIAPTFLDGFCKYLLTLPKYIADQIIGFVKKVGVNIGYRDCVLYYILLCLLMYIFALIISIINFIKSRTNKLEK